MNDGHGPKRLDTSQHDSTHSLDSFSDLSKQRLGFSISLSDATIGVSQDRLGDWTIAVGLSQRSDRYQLLVASLESLGFFQATENEGTAYLLWTSLFSEVGDVRAAAEQTLAEALVTLQSSAIPNYIG